MSIWSSREFNQDIGRAKRAAKRAPVIITDRGRPAFVLMRHETYVRLAGKSASVRALLAQQDGADVDFAPPRLGGDPVRPTQLL